MCNDVQRPSASISIVTILALRIPLLGLRELQVQLWRGNLPGLTACTVQFTKLWIRPLHEHTPQEDLIAKALAMSGAAASKFKSKIYLRRFSNLQRSVPELRHQRRRDKYDHQSRGAVMLLGRKSLQPRTAGRPARRMQAPKPRHVVP